MIFDDSHCMMMAEVLGNKTIVLTPPDELKLWRLSQDLGSCFCDDVILTAP